MLSASLAAGPALAQPAGPAASPQGAPPPQAAPPPKTPPPTASPSAAPTAPTTPTTPAAPASDGTPADGGPIITEEIRQEARSHFQRGLSLLREEAWAPALAEFLLSRKLFPTRAATNNAAITMRKLQRYDEALDMFETLLRDFQVPDAERAAAQRELSELRALVGTIDVAGAEPGASIVVSGEDRGEYPPVKPLRVAAGTHLVRVVKEGYEPFEGRVTVAGGQVASVTAKLRKLSASGQLRITERTGKSVEVLVDNVVVGRTPWEGRLGVGDHMVVLRGEGKLGSQPTPARVKSQELTSLALVAEELDASLRVDPTPPGASVWINAVNVGNGVWIGRLKTGSHRVEVKAEGFVPVVRTVALAKGQRETVTVTLERDEDAALWKKPARVTFDVSSSLLLAPTFSGDAAAGCGSECSRSVGLGALNFLHGGYELGSGLGFGLEAGMLVVAQQVTGRSATFTPNGLGPQSGTADDALRLTGFLGGATVGYHLGERFPALFRLGVGVMAGQMRDERRGHFRTSGGDTFDVDPVADFQSATYFYVDPEVRVGARFAQHFEVSAGVQALLLIAASQPRWNSSIELGASTDGIGRYPDETLMGEFVLMIAPGVSLRYDF
ncbi:PEGA domain-containing protein [Chondromyces apiculatus]|uniref:PEGA domain-containing protein n=1 Tax=Chondromyces apiculatus TaxID=51 RepID=UPI001E3D0CD2|nr:PEGA domain-containing protein [Chondromyces apiculatus]